MVSEENCWLDTWLVQIHCEDVYEPEGEIRELQKSYLRSESENSCNAEGNREIKGDRKEAPRGGKGLRIRECNSSRIKGAPREKSY